MTETGKRTRRITVQRASATRDSFGQMQPETWTDYTEAFAEVLFGTGAERRQAAQQQATVPATFIIPWTPKAAEIDAGDRLIMDGIWDITSAIPVGLSREVHITATKRTS